MTDKKPTPESDKQEEKSDNTKPEAVKEIGGRGGLEPTRYGDWEKDGRCTDF